MSCAAPKREPLRLCVVCSHASLEAVTNEPGLQALFAAHPDALLELRLDAYQDLSPQRLAQALMLLGPKRCILTFRIPQQGGLSPTPADDAVRVACLAVGQRLGVFAIDLETVSLLHNAALYAVWHRGPALRIASDHNLDGPLSLLELQTRRHAAEALGAALVKLVIAPQDMLDAEPLLTLLHTPSPNQVPLIGIATGAAGLWSRLLAGRWQTGAPWMYTLWPGAAAVADGQMSWTQASQMYRITQIDADTPVFGVIGAPVGHSKSPAWHNAWLAQDRRPGIYLPLHLNGNLQAFLSRMATPLGLVGLSVTHPLKQAAHQLARRCTKRAAATGAVNTLWRAAPTNRHRWYGDNTDVAAGVDSLKRLAQGKLANRCVLVVGAGGVARAIVYGAHQAGADVLIWARRPSQAHALSQAVGGRVVAPGPVAPQLGEQALVVNCTPVGMAESLDAMPIAIAGFAPCTRFFDTIYAPEQTAWLAAAAAANHPTCNGMAMFVHQARAQFQRFAKRNAL